MHDTIKKNQNILVSILLIVGTIISTVSLASSKNTVPFSPPGTYTHIPLIFYLGLAIILPILLHTILSSTEKKKTDVIIIYILGIAVLLRATPAFIYSGVYTVFDPWNHYGIVQHIIETQAISFQYSFSGMVAYSHWPALHELTAITSIVSGISLLFIAKFLPPIIGGLSVLWIYLITKKIFDDSQTALLSALFLAFAQTHIWRTGLFIQETLGHFAIMLLIFSVLLYIEKNDLNSIILIIFSIGLLYATHHQSSLIASLVIISSFFLTLILNRIKMFAPNKTIGTTNLKPSLLILSTMLVLIATVYFSTLGNTFLSSILTITVSAISKSGSFGGLIGGINSNTLFVGQSNLDYIQSYLPRIILIVLSTIGIIQFVKLKRIERKIKFGEILLISWTSAITLLLIIGILFLSWILIPYRMFIYLLEPLSIWSAYAITQLIKSRNKATRSIIICILTILFILSYHSAYPEDRSGGIEGYTMAEYTSFKEVSNLLPNNSIIYTDLRLSPLLALSFKSFEFNFYVPPLGHKISEPKDNIYIVAEKNYYITQNWLKMNYTEEQWIDWKNSNPEFNKIYATSGSFVYKYRLP